MDSVAEHYLTLSVDELIEDVLRPYRVNVWPQVEGIAASHSNEASTNGLILEGSALWPEFATGLDFDKVGALWLSADEETFRRGFTPIAGIARSLPVNERWSTSSWNAPSPMTRGWSRP